MSCWVFVLFTIRIGIRLGLSYSLLSFFYYFSDEALFLAVFMLIIFNYLNILSISAVYRASNDSCSSFSFLIAGVRRPPLLVLDAGPPLGLDMPALSSDSLVYDSYLSPLVGRLLSARFWARAASYSTWSWTAPAIEILGGWYYKKSYSSK